MFKRLEQVEARYNELNDRLSSGTLVPQELRKLAKEQSDLKLVVETYREYKEAQKEFASSKHILDTETDAELKTMAKDDVTRLEQTLSTLEQKLKVLLLPKDPNDDKNILLEIRAGTGGEEAALFAADLTRMYTRYAEVNRWKVEILSSSESDKGGYKEILLMISGNEVYSKLKYESGVHRVQRVPETEASGRIHTSAISVVVLPEAEDIELAIPETDLRIDVMRAGGAGGQHVNKTESAVRITHLPTGIVVVCKDDRSQHRNRAQAMKVLRSRLMDKYQQDQDDKESAQRRTMIGSGDRSEKIRTYNFPQSRVTDHRIGFTLHQLDSVLDGNLAPLIDALSAHYQAEALKGSNS